MRILNWFGLCLRSQLRDKDNTLATWESRFWTQRAEIQRLESKLSGLTEEFESDLEERVANAFSEAHAQLISENKYLCRRILELESQLDAASAKPDRQHVATIAKSLA